MSTTGLDVLQTRMEGLTNNIANATTPGFKKDNYLFKSFPEMLLIEKGGYQNERLPFLQPVRKVGITGIGARLTDVTTDFSMGNIQETGNKTDILLKGQGFFTVSKPDSEDPGRLLYTRNGAFRVDEEGYLATAGGYRVLGEQGDIFIGEAELRFQVSGDGSILIDNEQVDKLRLAEFSNLDDLYKETDDMFVDGAGTAERASATIAAQGFLEGSNVNAIDEMVNLISTTRAYEANQRLIQAQDELLSKAVNEVGSIK